MRYSLVVIMILLGLITPAFSQGWEWLSPLPQGNTLYDIDYLGGNRLFSTAYVGTSIASSDGGATWQLQENGDHICPQRVEFVNEQEGWGMTNDYFYFFGSDASNRIFHTVDGGQSWQLQYHNPALVLSDFTFLTDQIGWAVGYVDTSWSSSQLVILETYDGGVTWSEILHDSGGYGGDIFFLNEFEGWVSLDRSVLHTTDGGATWEPYYTGIYSLTNVVFSDGQHGWACNNHDLYRSVDAGRTWWPQSLSGINDRRVASVCVVGENNVWAVGGLGRVFRSVNAGQTWEVVVENSPYAYEKIIFIDELHGYMCGGGGVVYESNDGGVTWNQRCGHSLTDYSYSLNAVDFADLQHGWIAGHTWDGSAPILFSEDGGESWTEQYRDSVNAFYDIEAVSATNVWAVGTEVFHSTDGGQHWGVVNIGDHHVCLDIICDGEQNIWIASGWVAPLRVHRSTDTGVTWETHIVEGQYKFNGMAAAGANDVWISGWSDLDDSYLSHSGDGGATWEFQADTLSILDGLFFLNQLEGWATSYYGFVHTVDGGATWNVIDAESFPWIRQMRFFDSLNGWALTSSVHRTTDGGVTWQQYSPHNEGYVADMSFVSPTQGWLVDGGAVMHFDGSIFSAPEPPKAAPGDFTFVPAFPNPFNNETTLRFELRTAARTEIEIFDITGRHVSTLADRVYSAGRHEVRFDGANLASGLYFARAKTASMQATQKLVLLK